MTKIKNLIIFAAIATLAVIGLSSPSYAAGTDYYVSQVDGDDSNDCSSLEPCATIQAAVDLADDGDTISVGPGVYEENVVINRTANLSLIGDNTTIKAPLGGKTYGMAIRAPGTIVEGFIFDGADAGDTIKGISLGRIGGSNPAQPTNVTIRNNIFKNNNGGISNSNAQIDASGLVISNNTFVDNQRIGTANGSNGIYVNKAHGSNILIENNQFSNTNFGGHSSAIQISGIDGSPLENVTIDGNTSDNDGELLFIFLVNDATVTNNTGQNESRESAVRIGLATSNLEMSNNTLTNSEGGIRILNYPQNNTTVPSSNLNIEDNRITGMTNFAVFLESGSISDNVTIINNTLSNNGSSVVNESGQAITTDIGSDSNEDANTPGAPNTGFNSLVRSSTVNNLAISLLTVAAVALAGAWIYRARYK